MNNQEQLSRMKAMMTYGLTESKKNNFSNLEYNRIGADGKMYGIVREGTKYYIKVSDNTKELIKENFKYIGGFRNRKSNEYTSYANALKHFDLNMRSLNEAYGKEKKMIAESWNPEKQEFVMVEATQKMKDEIARQRQIMSNASMIFEGKDGSCECGNCQKSNQKNEFKKDNGVGSAEKANGTGFEEDVPKDTDVEGGIYRQIGEGTDHGTLAWHKTGGNAQETIADTYLDTSHGTQIGDGAPFDGCPKGDSKREMKNGTVEEEKSMAMDCGDNQNNPTPGVGDKMSKDKGPFNKGVKNELDEAEESEEVMDDEAPMGGEEDPMTDEDPMGGEEDLDDIDLGNEDLEGDDLLDTDLGDGDLGDDLESSDTSNEIASLRSEIDSLKELLSSVAEKLGVSSEEIADSEFNDAPLYGDEEGDDDEFDGEEDDTEFEITPDESDFDFDDEEDNDKEDFGEDDEDDDETEVFESRSYRRMKKLNEDRLDYFGKHPAWKKEPMTRPSTGEDQNSHGRDWNDDSVYSEKGYANQIGSGAPFDVNPADIENAIAESVKRILRKKNR